MSAAEQLTFDAPIFKKRPPQHQQAAGTGSFKRLPLRVIEERFGETRLALWRFLVAARNVFRGCAVEGTAEQIAKQANHAGWNVGSTRTVARTLREFDRAGVTEVTATKVVLRPEKTAPRGWIAVRIHTRRIYGGTKDGEVTLPKKVAEQIEGMRMAGSGNHKNHKGSPGNQNWKGRPETLEERTRARKIRLQERLRRHGCVPIVHDPETQRILDIEAEEKRRHRAILREARKARKQALLSPKTKTKKDGRSQDQKCPPLRSSLSPLDLLSEDARVEATLRGGSDLGREGEEWAPADHIPRAPRRTGSGGPPRKKIPPFPDLRSAQVPDSKGIPEEISVDDLAIGLAKLFSGALEKSFDRPAWQLRPRVLRTSKHWQTLLDAAETMIEQEIDPATWIIWSFNVWAQQRDTPPPVGWVFSSKRMETSIDWFERDAPGDLGGRITHGPIGKSFVDRYMRFHYRWAEDENAMEHLLEAFPEGYENALRAARAEARAIQQQLNQRVLNFEWVWG